MQCIEAYDIHLYQDREKLPRSGYGSSIGCGRDLFIGCVTINKNVGFFKSPKIDVRVLNCWLAELAEPVVLAIAFRTF